MDRLRVFSTFKSNNQSFDTSIKEKKKSLPLGPNGMIIKSDEDKPYKSRSEILEKIKKNQKKSPISQSAKVSGQKFGMKFLESKKTESEFVGDIAKNDPRDPMTTEKLKSMLHSGAVNFSGKEQRILSQILGH